MAANTVVLTAADGRIQELPLQLLLERGAVLANRVNGEPLSNSMGGVNQLWCPGLPAKYFIRDIVSIEFEERDVVPQLPGFEDDGNQFTNRPNVSVEADYICRRGVPLHLEGYADDYDRAIVAIEFSLDEGVNWDRRAVEATIGRVVRWTLDLVLDDPGSYVLRVRSVNEDGKVSPTCAVHRFEVI